MPVKTRLNHIEIENNKPTPRSTSPGTKHNMIRFDVWLKWEGDYNFYVEAIADFEVTHTHNDELLSCQNSSYWRKTENRSGRLLRSCLKTYLKSLCYVFSQNLLHLFIRVNYENYIYLKKSCHVFQYGIIARGLPTHKISHLTKPASKLPVPNTMGQKRSKIKC
ncbi:hypothetical protein LXL04_011579 [Taraxacum kok-saghyz]